MFHSPHSLTILWTAAWLGSYSNSRCRIDMMLQSTHLTIYKQRRGSERTPTKDVELRWCSNPPPHYIWTGAWIGAYSDPRYRIEIMHQSIPSLYIDRGVAGPTLCGEVEKWDNRNNSNSTKTITTITTKQRQ